MLFRVATLLVIACLGACLGACNPREPEPLVVFIGLDGASLDIVDELRAAGELPTFDRLMRTGVSGPLQSWASKPILSENLRRGFWSPIVWTSIATGKIPEKHGVRDFVLPVPGSSSVFIGSDADPARALVTLPELHGRLPLRLILRLRSHRPAGEQSVQLLLNDEAIGTVRVPVEWTELTVPIPAKGLAPVRNELELVFSRQRGHRAGELAFIDVEDANGRTLFSLDPAYARERLGRGFRPPRAQLTEVQSIHWKAKPFWTLLGETGIPVGVVGYWGTWPAYEVNGFLVSSRMGIREQRTGSDRLTWPEDLASELAPLAPNVDDLKTTFERLHVSECEPPLIDSQSVLKKILMQDEYYVRIAKKLLPTMESGLFAIYLRSIDVAGHPTLHWRHGAPVPEGCPESVRGVMDATYGKVDRWIAEVLEALPRRATVVLVSDHGMQPIEGGGHHAPFGLFVASGDGIRRGSTFRGSTVLDVAPTMLYLLGSSIPLDMDGKMLASIFESAWLGSHAPRYVDADTSLTPDRDTTKEASPDAIEELKALGYIE